MNKLAVWIMSLGIIGYVLTMFVSLFLLVGYIIDIFKIIHHISDPITGEFILRCVGIFVFPIGGILGYF